MRSLVVVPPPLSQRDFEVVAQVGTTERRISPLLAADHRRRFRRRCRQRRRQKLPPESREAGTGCRCRIDASMAVLVVGARCGVGGSRTASPQKLSSAALHRPDCGPGRNFIASFDWPAAISSSGRRFLHPRTLGSLFAILVLHALAGAARRHADQNR